MFFFGYCTAGIRVSGEHLLLRKNRTISYLWYNCGWYLDMLFKNSFNSSYGLAQWHVVVGRSEREREPVISLPYWPDVSDVRARKSVTGPLKSHVTYFYSQLSQNEQVLSCNTISNYQHPKIFR